MKSKNISRKHRAHRSHTIRFVPRSSQAKSIEHMRNLPPNQSSLKDPYSARLLIDDATQALSHLASNVVQDDHRVLKRLSDEMAVSTVRFRIEDGWLKKYDVLGTLHLQVRHIQRYIDQNLTAATCDSMLLARAIYSMVRLERHLGHVCVGRFIAPRNPRNVPRPKPLRDRALILPH